MTVVYPPGNVGGGTVQTPPRAVPTPGPAADAQATVTVAGLGQSLVVPDALRLELSVEATEGAVTAAMGVARAAMAEVRRAVTDAGVAEADQQTSGLTIWPGHDDKGGGLVSYVATESLTVMLRRTDLVDVVLSAAADVAGDHLRVGGLGFTVTDPSSAQDEARRLAVAEARRRAELYAAEVGASVGPLLRLAEGRGDRESGDVMAAAGRRLSKSVEPGTQVVSMQVTATWALLTRPSARARAEPQPAIEPPDAELQTEPPAVEPAPPVDPR